MFKKLFIAALSLTMAVMVGLGCIVSVHAEAAIDNTTFKIEAKSALLMDCDSGTIVYEQNSKQHLPIASMIKIMTLLITFEEVNNGNLAITDEIVASENATSMGGSQAFLDSNSVYTLDELIKSITVGSANDSCVAVAEKIGGSVEGFVAKMNEKAAQLGMKDTAFVNCTGLPAAGQYSCANDVAIMTRELLKHTEFYKYSTLWMFDFKHPSGRVTQLSNTNKLIRAYEGCDGGKTGFTAEAKFCLSATAKRGTMRLISVVCGAETSKIRNGENAKLFNYGFANYETKQLVFKGVALDGDYAVTNGKEKTIKAAPIEDYFVFSKKGDKNEFRVEYCMDTVCAPIDANQMVGQAKIYCGGNLIGSVNLVSDKAVKKISYFDIIDDFITNW